MGEDRTSVRYTTRCHDGEAFIEKGSVREIPFEDFSPEAMQCVDEEINEQWTSRSQAIRKARRERIIAEGVKLRAEMQPTIVQSSDNQQLLDKIAQLEARLAQVDAAISNSSSDSSETEAASSSTQGAGSASDTAPISDTAPM